MDIRTRVRKYITGAISQEIDDQDDIFELGVVDSLFAMQLVAYVEKEFSIVAERDDLDIDNFCSIAAVTAFVIRKLGQTTASRSGHGHTSY